MSQNVEVIVYGTVCLDLLWRVECLPPAGGYVEILEEKRAIGGEAANTAIALARWGVKTGLVGNPIGVDFDGMLLRQLFDADVPELSLDNLQFSGAVQTPYCVCISTPDGQRTMFGHRFENLVCTPLTPGMHGRWFTVEPNAYESGIVAAEEAARRGAKVVAMDYAREARVNRVASLVLTSSEHVGRALSIGELAEFACSVRDEYGVPVIVTVGERGCIVATVGPDGNDILRIPAFTAPTVVDSTGSGDIFRAGVIFGLNRGDNLVDAIRFAAAAASLNCTQMGGWGGVRSVVEIEQHRDTADTNPL